MGHCRGSVKLLLAGHHSPVRLQVQIPPLAHLLLQHHRDGSRKLPRHWKLRQPIRRPSTGAYGLNQNHFTSLSVWAIRCLTIGVWVSCMALVWTCMDTSMYFMQH